ncbi:PhzF family phenazine biosynthesis protein [Undibacterium griseum]|uniref:PhzF family phenazine biosynthesis protein n=1 Tax=Undibacterium griseum TaxID=2762295 RepID=A0ABR6YQ74_9BURK|nr:PhzF family phenazine biosynthesis protein [Undibacterium griseum]MBC3886066.1 PhzF family phenazine biosynthesis protein [Undibacterium griseum]
MREYAYRILNVFAESTFGGNPLCVIEDGRGLSDAEMQALALQQNLSETVFILPSSIASARIRIFTPGTEMAFAGHPSLGAGQVVSELNAGVASLTLECKAGTVPLSYQDGIWSLTAPQQPIVRDCPVPATEIARMLGLTSADLLAQPLWVNTGSDQLLVAVQSVDAVRRARLDAALLRNWPVSSLGRRTVYVFAPETEDQLAGQVTARYFFARPDGGVGEDPATGSACANLGGWWLAQQRCVPARLRVWQGEQMHRPSCLYLEIGADQQIRVGGKVIEIARGRFRIEGKTV